MVNKVEACFVHVLLLIRQFSNDTAARRVVGNLWCTSFFGHKQAQQQAYLGAFCLAQRENLSCGPWRYSLRSEVAPACQANPKSSLCLFLAWSRLTAVHVDEAAQNSRKQGYCQPALFMREARAPVAFRQWIWGV